MTAGFVPQTRMDARPSLRSTRPVPAQDPVEQAVERAITAMRSNLGELFTIDDMAHVAMFSKFHFTRIFQRATGVSPGRFLSALRLQEAKLLLVSTSLNVVDISIQVGYNSVGTFSSRFSKSVGMSPTAYRRLGGYTSSLPDEASVGAGPAASGVVEGHVWPPSGARPGLTFVGLFPNRIPEGRPVRCAILERPGSYRLDRVPDGVWYLLSHSVCTGDPGDALDDRPATARQGLAVGAYGPVTIRRGTVVRAGDLRLKPVCSFDPPVLLALLDLREVAADDQPLLNAA